LTRPSRSAQRLVVETSDDLGTLTIDAMRLTTASVRPFFSHSFQNFWNGR
jgi:hypothetical protein